MIFAATLKTISLNLFNSNYEPRQLGTWVPQPWIVHGRQWDDWMDTGKLELSRGILALGHLSCVRQVDASPQWMEVIISCQTSPFWYRTVAFIRKCCAS